jgi:hypothetical protein
MISLKKTLILPQDIENKGSAKISPPRSMVLKVVTGKILETLELAPGLTACGSVSESRKKGAREGFRLRRCWSDSQWERPEAAPTFGLSKIVVSVTRLS